MAKFTAAQHNHLKARLNEVLCATPLWSAMHAISTKLPVPQFATRKEMYDAMLNGEVVLRDAASRLAASEATHIDAYGLRYQRAAALEGEVIKEIAECVARDVRMRNKINEILDNAVFSGSGFDINAAIAELRAIM